MKITIAKLTAENIPDAIACIHDASRANERDYPSSFIKELNERHYNVNWLQQKLQKSDVYGAFFQNELIGTVSNNECEVVNVFVRLSVQGKGVGSQLMDFIEKKLRAQGCTRSYLSANLTSVEFYKKRGYTVVKSDEQQIKSWVIRSFEMIKTL